MTPFTFLLLSVAGGIGAALRFVLDGMVRERTTASYPVGTTLINVTGSFVLGVLTSAAAGGIVDTPVALVLGTGMMGGYTTFSTASYETVRLLQERRWLAGGLNAFATLVMAVAAALLGWFVGAHV